MSDFCSCLQHHLDTLDLEHYLEHLLRHFQRDGLAAQALPLRPSLPVDQAPQLRLVVA